MNEDIKKIADDIRNKSSIPAEENFGSVIAIIMIISVILTIIRVLQECNRNKLSNDISSTEKCKLYGDEIRNYSFRKGWFTKLRIKKIIRQNMSREQYQKYGASLMNAILEEGEQIKDEQIQTLLEAANV